MSLLLLVPSLTEGTDALKEGLPLLEKHGLAVALVLCVLMLVALSYFLYKYAMNMMSMLKEQLAVNKSQAEDIGQLRKDVSSVQIATSVILDRTPR